LNWKHGVGATAAVLLFIAVGFMVNEARKPPASKSRLDRTNPLTDVARQNHGSGPAPLAPLLPAPAADSSPQPEAVAPDPIPPEDMADPSNPPRWTKPLAEPGPPNPPDPFTPPPMEVDPDRGRRGDTGP